MSLVDQINLGFEAVAEKIKLLVPPPLDTFNPGWSQFPLGNIANVITTGTAHAAVNFGPENPTVAGVAFEQSNNNTNNVSVPNTTGGFSGTNWKVTRIAFAPTPPPFGSNAQVFIGAFPDLPDPSFGDTAGMSEMCEAAIRRSFYFETQNLVVGQRYYACFFFLGYPGTSTATVIKPNTGDALSFGVDGVGTIFSQGIQRFGFTATATTMGFVKYGPDNNGSYCNAALILNE